jgi:hypothetical protein
MFDMESGLVGAEQQIPSNVTAAKRLVAAFLVGRPAETLRTLSAIT